MIKEASYKASPKLDEVGLSVTSPRIKILQLFERAQSNQIKHHMNAEEVYKKLSAEGKDVSLATIYRVLTQFESAGILMRHNFGGGAWSYELAVGEHHDHLVCVKCQKIEEFVDSIIEERQEAIASQKHFKMTDHNLIIYGICGECLKKEQTSD